MRSVEELIGRRPRTKIYRGEPILEAKLIPADARDHPAQQVPPGYRIVSVRVDPHTGGAGLLRPGDRVDVQLFAKKDPRTGVGTTTTKTILKEIRVFAVEQDFRRTSDQDETAPPRTVSLVVTPEQADKLTLASRLGEINLIIRNPDDTSNEDSGGSTLDDLLVTSRGAREKERGTRGSDENRGQSGFLSFIKNLQQTAQQSTANLTGSQVAGSGPWTMLILEGSEVREVQVNRDGPLSDASVDPRFNLPPTQAPRAASGPRTETTNEGNEEDPLLEFDETEQDEEVSFEIEMEETD
jgi:pilus assembly protein CpaB